MFFFNSPQISQCVLNTRFDRDECCKTLKVALLQSRMRFRSCANRKSDLELLLRNFLCSYADSLMWNRKH